MREQPSVRERGQPAKGPILMALRGRGELRHRFGGEPANHARVASLREHLLNPRQFVVARIAGDERERFHVTVRPLHCVNKTQQSRRIESTAQVDPDWHVRAEAQPHALSQERKVFLLHLPERPVVPIGTSPVSEVVPGRHTRAPAMPSELVAWRERSHRLPERAIRVVAQPPGEVRRPSDLIGLERHPGCPEGACLAS